MHSDDFDVVTGAFGYTGRYIARLLLSKGRRVRTLTGYTKRPNPFGDKVEVARFNFDRPEELVKNLEGAATLINTYWVRFDHGNITYDKAVANTRILIDAAVRARVRRFVHVSITNPSEHSPTPYFRGKAALEKALIESGLSYAIIRPTVIFGPEDILINNIAWLLRKFPLFAIPGSGEYGLQPIFVEDMAALVVELASDWRDQIVDAVGPEIYTFDELVRLVAKTVGSKSWIFHVPPRIAFLLSRMIGWMVGDVVLTHDEVVGLMANLLISDKPPTGSTRLSEWLEQNRSNIGTSYASELARHFR